MQVQALGHVVPKVRDLQLAEDFYLGTLGMKVVLRIEDPPMTFITLETPGSHHDFALMEIGAVASTPAVDATGLAHVEAERKFTRSLHVLDPDGNEIELYVDLSDTCS